MPENAIVRRVAHLTTRWLDFTDRHEARVLRWVGDTNDLRMLDAFLAYQTSDARNVPDLFIRPDTRFQAGESFGLSVVREIAQDYQDGKSSLHEVGIPSDWVAPTLDGGDGIISLSKCLLSLQRYHADLADHIVLVLDSPEPKMRGIWLEWFRRMLALDTPDQLRILVVEHERLPMLEGLGEGPHAAKIVSEGLALDMPSAYRELAKAGDAEHQGVAFRQAFVELAQAIEKGDLTAARISATEALRIAVSQEWWDPALAVHIALAGALIAADHPKEALDHYQQAVDTSQAAVDEGSETGPGLLVRSRLAYAGALFGAGHFGEAGHWYEETATMKEAENDPLLRVEAWRMASHAYGNADQTDRCWESGWKGLDAADALDGQSRQSSTLPYLGLWLLDLCRRAGAADSAKAVRDRLDAQLGPGWQPTPPEASDPGSEAD